MGRQSSSDVVARTCRANPRGYVVDGTVVPAIVAGD
jgi:hypothetical protein